MCSSRTNMCKFLSNIPPYILNLIFLSLLLFIDSYEARGSISSRGQSSVPCPKFSYAQLYIRDQLDCKMFYICFGRRFWKLSCPGSTVFSSKHKVCVWKNSRNDNCRAVKEKIISSTTAPIFTISVSTTRNTAQKTKPNKGQKTVPTLTTVTTNGVTATITEMTTARTISKAKSLTTNKREIETTRPVKNTATELSNGEVTAKTITSTITVRPLLTTSRTLSTKSQLKLKTKLWTSDEHVTKWWQRKTLKWWKKEKWFTKITTKTTEPTRRVHTNPKNEMEYCGEIITSSYIIGGQPSLPGRWPWQASLQIVSAGQPWHRCGGVLVHPLWIVTAAHCVEGRTKVDSRGLKRDTVNKYKYERRTSERESLSYCEKGILLLNQSQDELLPEGKISAYKIRSFYGNLKNWRVVMAEGDLDSNSGSEVDRKLSRIVSHPGYKRASNFPNDIAMLQMDEPVDVYGRNIRMACLPPMEETKLFGHGNCWISGWGETRGSGKQNGLNELGVDIVPKKDCESMWDRVDIEVLDQQVCVGYGDTGACYGDSGGPLMCEVNGTYYLGGVMSWLINNCSAKGFPNVFTRVQSYLDWIRHNIDYYHWWRYS